MPIKERTGLDGIEDEQEVWRFMPWRHARELLFTAQLHLSQVSELRRKDSCESRLPPVLHDALARSYSVQADGRVVMSAQPLTQPAKDFMAFMLRACEDQATGVFASYWFLPGSPAQEERMWQEYGNVRISSTIGGLTRAVPDDMMLSFGIGLMRYISPNLDYSSAFHLNEYRSAPFLLKLESHSDDREIRLYQRHRGPLCQSECLKVPVNLYHLVKSIRLSPYCPHECRNPIYQELISKGVPQHLLEGATV